MFMASKVEGVMAYDKRSPPTDSCDHTSNKKCPKNIHLRELYNKQRDRVMGYDNGPLYAFFISNTFISNATLKSARNQADAKQHHEAEH